MSHTAPQPEHYATLLDEKVQHTSTLLSQYTDQAPQVFASKPLHYRMRVEFRLWHEGDDLNYVMFDPASPKEPVIIDEFSIAHERITALMPILLAAVKSNPELKRRIFQVEFLATTTGRCLVTLIYHRKLDDLWRIAAEQLQHDLDVLVIGRARKQRIILQEDYLIEQLEIDQKIYNYQQIENSFTQPNAGINAKMIGWAKKCARYCQRDLLELYCGNGNFTLPLSEHFDKVLATEISKTSIRAANHNLTNNSIDNVQMVRMSAEDITAALNNVRIFRRLKDIDLDSYQLNTLFVDPPRAGLDEQTLDFAAQFDNIIYVSCNAETLAANLQQLSLTHSIDNWAVFDQFPYTKHIELGVFLRKATL